VELDQRVGVTGELARAVDVVGAVHGTTSGTSVGSDSGAGRPSISATWASARCVSSTVVFDVIGSGREQELAIGVPFVVETPTTDHDLELRTQRAQALTKMPRLAQAAWRYRPDAEERGGRCSSTRLP
jgi:hypothetical protein